MELARHLVDDGVHGRAVQVDEHVGRRRARRCRSRRGRSCGGRAGGGAAGRRASEVDEQAAAMVADASTRASAAVRRDRRAGRRRSCGFTRADAGMCGVPLRWTETGSGARSYTLSLSKRKLSTFNKEACIFLEDEPRNNAKPNPYGINMAMKQMRAKHVIYVGDSVEDVIMVAKAKEEMGLEVEFIGVYGSSAKPMETRNALKQKGAGLVLWNVNKLPNILNKVM